ncbi:MAG: chloride channel protein [Sodalis sp. (in: enterobacteria)]|uniref:chloride channel protein n=1 Tax=Sodalis sp. (in: enterobacteria) TaxID=1898979 RepID=UPI003F2ABB41
MLYRYGRPLVSIARALAAVKPAMPVVATLIHALLQIITVALGSPLGREVAPREVGAGLAAVCAVGRCVICFGSADENVQLPGYDPGAGLGGAWQ